MSSEYALGVWRQQPGQKGFDVEVVANISADEFRRYVDAVATYRSLSERNTFQILNRNHSRLVSMLAMYTNLERVGGVFRTVNKRNVVLLFMGEFTNWLASTRLYLESERDFIVDQFGEESEELQTYRRATSQAFDAYAGYRFLYNLRDYAQHCGPPVSGMTVSRSSTGGTQIDMYLSRSDLLVARFAWSRHAKALLTSWPEQILVMPLVEEAMAGFRQIEDAVLGILLRRCAAATTTMRQGIEQVGSIEGHPAVFQLPEADKEDGFAWQTLPELSTLNAIDRAVATGDPLASLRKTPEPEEQWSPLQQHANAKAAAVVAAWLEHGGGAEFADCVNRILKEDNNITPLVSGLTNLSVLLIKMLGEALGSPPQDLLGGFVNQNVD
jgi:hypothetical protein